MEVVIEVVKWALHSYGPVLALGAVLVLGPLTRGLWLRAITRDGQILQVVERATSAISEDSAAKREVAAQMESMRRDFATQAEDMKRRLERAEQLLAILVQSKGG